MSFQDCLIVQRADTWSIVVGSEVETLSVDSSAEELVTCVTVMARLAGLKQFQCILAPASTSCFFARFDGPPATDLRDRVELTYALEDHLPIDAESMVADFRRLDTSSDAGKQVAAVAVPLEPWNEIADNFESAGIPVRSIVPASLLAVGVLASQYSQSQTVDYLLVQGASCDWLRTERGSITDWKVLGMETKALDQHRRLASSAADKIVAVTSNHEEQQLIESVFGSMESVSQPLADLELKGGEMLIKRRFSPYDLRRDLLGPPDAFRLIQTPLRCAVVAAVVLLIAVTFGSWYRTQRIETEIASLQSEQRSLFEKSFPDQRVPAALLRRIRSEHARVMASRGSGGSIDLPLSARSMLVRLLSSLPNNLRFRVTQIDIENGQLDVELEVRSPVDAGTLASHLSSVGFRVKPPVTTQSDAKTFVSSLEAEWVGSPQSDLSSSGLSSSGFSQPAASGDRASVSFRLKVNDEVRG
jgi:DNA-binding MarR family transcriptional regulator